MARIKPPAPHQANLTAQQKADAAARLSRRRIAMRRAATIITAEEAAALRVKEHDARATSESEEESYAQHAPPSSAPPPRSSCLPDDIWAIFDDQPLDVVPVNANLDMRSSTPTGTDEGSETEPEEDTFSNPEPEQVIKLSAQPCGAGGRVQWRGRLRGGGRGDVFLECAWVRKNLKPYAPPNRTLPPVVDRG